MKIILKNILLEIHYLLNRLNTIMCNFVKYIILLLSKSLELSIN